MVDPLPLWNDTETKQTLVDYVATVTDPSQADFIGERERMSVFMVICQVRVHENLPVEPFQ